MYPLIFYEGTCVIYTGCGVAFLWKSLFLENNFVLYVQKKGNCGIILQRVMNIKFLFDVDLTRLTSKYFYRLETTYTDLSFALLFKFVIVFILRLTFLPLAFTATRQTFHSYY